MTTHEQKAQELAERCVVAIDKNPKFNHWRYDRLFLVEAILNELNLTKLVEDEAMMDWLCDTAIEIKRAGQPPNSIWCNTIPIRTAIRDTMKENSR